MLRITPTLSIDPAEIEEVFVRSSGPGGQNVNKVSTAVQLKFDVARSPALSEAMRARVRAFAGKRMTSDGVLVIMADRYRSQARNRDDARQRLIELLRQAATPPKPRRATRPTAASKRQRREAKRHRSAIKSLRARRMSDD